MEAFYHYTAEVLKKLGASPGELSATQRQEKMKVAVRNLLSGILGNSEREGTFQEGKEILEDCRKIIDEFIKTTPKADLYQEMVRKLSEDEGNQAHCARVSTLAAMISLSTGIGKPEELAMAGLLHDIGETLLPPELQNRDESEMNEKEREAHKKHIDLTFELAQKRKIILSDTLRKCILQHHERWNGSGYPKGVVGKLISPEAQLLGIADEIEQQLSLRAGRRRSSPREAIRRIREEGLIDPGKQRHDPVLLNRVLTLFGEDQRAA
jgi:HD-GYP domain-containing protein (c-di-GMP phosphodiesterase class II)